MREAFIDKNMRESKLRLIAVADQIIAEYQKAGYRLTLRQLYYQMVSRNIIPNSERAYKLLGETVSDGRLTGYLDWAAIEDRVRVPRMPTEFDDLQELVHTALNAYRLPRWRDQDYYVELWVEKDALAGVLEPLARQYHVTMMVNRGYSSQSAMYDASKRFIAAEERGQSPVLLYLGDHDPSGEDMVRDIADRLRMFGVDGLTVSKVALTMDQVLQYNPPPNPAKMSDSRAAEYVAKHGGSSWEVDALPPDVLQQLIHRDIQTHLDIDKMNEVIAQEQKDRDALKAAVTEITKDGQE